VTSSVTSPFEIPRPLSYRLPIVTYLLAPLVFEIFDLKVADKHSHKQTHPQNSTLTDNKGPLKLSAREPINALRLPCVRCGGSKGTEPAAGAFTGTTDSWTLQDGIKDSSSLHPVTIPNCLLRRALVMTLFMLRRFRNCRRYYYYYI